MSAVDLTPARPVADGLAAAWRRHGLALAGVLLAIVALYWGTAQAMVGIWMRSETFAHAFVVPPISLWLIWRLRQPLLATAPRAVPWLAAVLAVLAAAWGLGYLVATNAITQLMFTAMLVAAVPAVLGWAVTRVILFPLGFLFFAVPVGEFATPWLMQYTADFTVAALRASGVPVYREGLQFVIPSGHWSVVEACSGIRYLMASLMAGALFAYLNYRSMGRRWAFVGVSIAVPIIANWLRAYMIVMLGHLSNNKIATGVDHLLYGWVFFGVVIMLMFFIGARWAEPEAEHPVPAAGSALARPGTNGTLALACALLLLAVAWPPLLAQRALGAAASASTPALALPARWPSGEETVTGALPEWSPRFLAASASDQRVYAGPQGASGAVGVYLAYIQQQTGERKLVSSENMLVHSEDTRWNQVAAALVPLELASGHIDLRATTLTGLPDGRFSVRPRLRIWRLYWVDGQFVGSDWRAKLAQARQVLAGRGDGGASLVLYTAEDSAEAADKRLAAFMAAHAGEIDRQLQALRAR